MVGAPMLTGALEAAAAAGAATPEPAPETMVLPAKAPAALPAARMVSGTHFLCDLESLTAGPDTGSEFLRVMVASLTGCRLTAGPGGRATTFRLRASTCVVRASRCRKPSRPGHRLSGACRRRFFCCRNDLYRWRRFFTLARRGSPGARPPGITTYSFTIAPARANSFATVIRRLNAPGI